MVLLVASMLKGIYGEVGEVDGGSGKVETAGVLLKPWVTS